MKRHVFLGPPVGVTGAPFTPHMGSFAAVPLKGAPSQPQFIGVPYPTMVFWVYNRYLPQYWPPKVPFEK